MNKQPLISVIVPVYNSNGYVSQLVESIQKQMYSHWELIFVDDGSDRNSIEKLECIVKQDERISLYERNRLPKGSVTCRNIGMSYAKGDYIIHFDSDDLVEPFCFEQRVKFMEENKTLDFAIFKGATFFIGNDNEIHYTRRTWGNKRKENDLESFLKNDYPFSVWSCIYRAKKFKNILWDEHVKIYTDFSYIIPSLLGDFKYSYCSDSRPDYLYRINHSNTMTSNFVSEEKMLSTIYLFSKTQKQLSNSIFGNLYKKWFKTYFIIQLERVINSKNRKYILAFRDCFERFYGNEIRLRILILLSDFFKNSTYVNRKIIRLLVTMFYRPEILSSWIVSHIKK